MANVISNVALVPGIYMMKIEGTFKGEMGQFYMLRSGTGYPLLPRPISIYDIGDEDISFLYRVVGEGTHLFSQLQSGQEIQLEGPFGNGFPQVEGSLALIGGGMGTAPLLLAAKHYPHAHVYLGFALQAFGVDAFEAVAASVQVRVGGKHRREGRSSSLCEYVFLWADSDATSACGEDRRLVIPFIYFNRKTYGLWYWRVFGLHHAYPWR